MQPAGPIFVNNLFEPMLDRLLQLLRSLSEQEWGNATPCAGWTVKDLALHLLGDEIGQLSRGRDKDFSSLLPPGADLVERINKNNALWVEAMRRMSPRLLCDLLDVTGHQVVDYFKSLDLMAMNGTVSWVGPDPAPVWLDVAREYTERWHHQQHIREAVGQPGLMEAEFLAPVLDTFVRALPYTFRAVSVPVGTMIQFTVVGDAGQTWCMLRDKAGWALSRDTPVVPAASVTLDEQTAWKLFTKGIAKDKAKEHARVQGDEALAATLFDAVAIIA
jgi:uncharacterized protein (TIGR03083 family)